MAITNRALDVSQQKNVLRRVFGPAVSTGGTFIVGVAAGGTYMLGMVPTNSVLKAAYVACENMGNSLVLAFNVKRFIAGAGITVINGLFGTLALQNFSVSGIQGVSILAAGSTLLGLLPGDQFWLSPTGTSGTADDLTVDLVLQDILDVKQTFGSST